MLLSNYVQSKKAASALKNIAFSAFYLGLVIVHLYCTGVDKIEKKN